KAGLAVFHQFRYSPDSRTHHRLAEGHRLGNHITEDLFPSRDLADHICRAKNSFGYRVFDLASTCHVVFKTHLNCLASVSRTVRALADEYKMNVWVPGDHKTRRRQQIADTLVRNNPA